MKNAGCYSIVLAPETGDPYIIKKIQKGFSLEETEQVFQWCKELDFFTPIYIMIGFPFENLNHIQNTLNFLKKVKPDIISIHKFYPFPNTPIYEEYNLKSYENEGYQTAKIEKDFQKIYANTYLTFYLNPKNLINITSKMGLKYLLNSSYKYLSRNFKEIIKRKIRVSL